MAINFETVTGNQTSANVLTQINNNFAKISSGSVSNADFATNADTVDNKHASELIPGAAIFLDSITSLDDLSVGRYFCTQTEQSWEPVATIGSRTFLIEVSLDIPNNLKSYKINYIAGEGAGESYYSDYSSGSIRWNRVVTNENIKNYNYFIFNNRKVQPVLAQDGYYMVENNKQANLITDDGTKYFKISASAPVDNISTITIEMYNTDTDELLDSKAVTYSTSSTPSLVAVYSDNNTIIFATSTNSASYVITFSENLITTVEQTYIHTQLKINLTSNLNDGRYSNDNYIIGYLGTTSYFVSYDKSTKETNTIHLNSISASGFDLTPSINIGFLSRDANILAGMGEEQDLSGAGGRYRFRPGAFIYHIDDGIYVRLNLGSINSNIDEVKNSSTLVSSGANYSGIVIVGNFVYISIKYNNYLSGIYKFNATNGTYIGYIPYDNAKNLKLLYQDDKTILCVDGANIFEIDVDSFTIKNREDNCSIYTLNPVKTQVEQWIPPVALNDRYHKIAVNKAPSGGGVSKIDYYMGYNDYWVDIGGV